MIVFVMIMIFVNYYDISIILYFNIYGMFYINISDKYYK